jgi:hypothetical protein
VYTKFNSIFNADNYKKKLLIQALVTGKVADVYIIPKKIRLVCSQKESCGNCSIPGSIMEIKPEYDNALPFIDLPENKFIYAIKAIAKRNCKDLRYEVIDVQNVERIFISAPTGRHREKSSATYAAYYVGIGIEANHNYDFVGYPTIDTQTQKATIVFDKAKKLKTDIETFKMTPEIHERLKKFNLEENTADKIFEHLTKLYETYAHNITQIYQRFDLHLALDLAYHTVITFKFANEVVNKGWADIIIIGDSRTGKGFVAERLAKYYNIGEVAAAENCSIAGLIGGAEQHSGYWGVTWGRIPLNDLGLIILDEASELKEEWKTLSRVRSEGVASIDKIVKQSTNARTRFVALTNANKKKISAFAYGIQAIPEVIQYPDGIARFDYALVVSDTEVATVDINVRRGTLPEMYNQEDEQFLVLWTWSRQQEDIEFTEKALDAIYDLATRIAGSYISDIPLIQGTNVRIKLAKIAIAFAARLYSNKNEGRTLLVEAVHVECAYIFLNLIYKKPVSGYYTMSQLSKSLQAMYSEKDMDSINAYLSSFTANKVELCKCMLNNNVLTVRDIAEHLNFSPEIAQEIISRLLKANMISKKFQNSYAKNKHFTDWLKQQVLDSKKVEENK